MERPEFNVEYLIDPSQEELRKLTLEHVPAVMKSKYGNLMKMTKNKARMAMCTFIIAEDKDKEKYSGNTIPRAEAQELIKAQKEYIEKKGKLIEVDGYIGLGKRSFPVQWLYTMEGANVAGMQKILAFSREMVEKGEKLKEEFKPTFRLVMTPRFFPEGAENDTKIIVDLENWTTYVMGSDYFGESKKGALRMLCEYVFKKGGLVLHAGAKLVKSKDKRHTMAIMGLSGTGKTTTTFSKQGELTQPIQDDMVCIWPGGECSITENGCFAKTYGLTEETEPIIFHGTLDENSWIENVYIDNDGEFDFSKKTLAPEEVSLLKDHLIRIKNDEENLRKYIQKEINLNEILDENDIPKDGWDFVMWTQNGRSIIPMSSIEEAADLHDIPPITSIGILNRDEGNDAAVPGIVRFNSAEQAAAYFMLGETTKTSAAGKDRGKTRSPFTQPFFPKAFGLQAKRFSELADDLEELDMWLMNTGYIGGDQKDVDAGTALKVKIRHSSAMLEAMLSEKIKWKKDPDFGYDIVDIAAPENKELIEKVPIEILNPITYFEKNGKVEDYHEWVKRIKSERKEFLSKFGLGSKILDYVI